MSAHLGKYNLTISPSSPCMRYVQLVCGGYQWATDKKIPSESPEARKLSDESNQSQVPFLLPAVSTWPGQFPTLKWNPVLSRGPMKKLIISMLKQHNLSVFLRISYALSTWKVALIWKLKKTLTSANEDYIQFYFEVNV